MKNNNNSSNGYTSSHYGSKHKSTQINHPPTRDTPRQDLTIRFESSHHDSTQSLYSTGTDQASRIPILSLSSQSLTSATTADHESQQSTTATSLLPTTATSLHNPHLSSNYIHLSTVQAHAAGTLDDSSIVTLASSNRRCRSFDSNTNLSTLGIPPLSIIERHHLNSGITVPNSPVLSVQHSSVNLRNSVAGDVGSIKTHWTAGMD